MVGAEGSEAAVKTGSSAACLPRRDETTVVAAEVAEAVVEVGSAAPADLDSSVADRDSERSSSSDTNYMLLTTMLSVLLLMDFAAVLSVLMLLVFGKRSHRCLTRVFVPVPF